MWGFALMFWLVPCLILLMITRRRRWERWAYARHAVSPRLERELDEHRVYVDSLERRVADLEERLDFTERLLAERREPVSQT
jgi:hypothetical protein